MAQQIELSYTKKDDIPAGYEDLYTEKDNAFVLSGVKGLKTQTDVDKLNEALRKERSDHKAVKDQLSVWGDLKHEEVTEQLSKIEEYKKAAEGKLNEEQLNDLVEKRIVGRLTPIEKEKTKLNGTISELTAKVAQLQTEKLERTISDSIRDAIGKAKGFQTTAVEDALLLGSRIFQVTEDGKVRTKDNVGVTPDIDPSVWLQELQDKKPHWWTTSQGGGAPGNPGNSQGQGTNPWSANNWNLTQQAAILMQDPKKAEQLARSAGTSIGGPRPTQK